MLAAISSHLQSSWNHRAPCKPIPNPRYAALSPNSVMARKSTPSRWFPGSPRAAPEGSKTLTHALTHRYSSVTPVNYLATKNFFGSFLNYFERINNRINCQLPLLSSCKDHSAIPSFMGKAKRGFIPPNSNISAAQGYIFLNKHQKRRAKDRRHRAPHRSAKLVKRPIRRAL